MENYEILKDMRLNAKNIRENLNEISTYKNEIIDILLLVSELGSIAEAKAGLKDSEITLILYKRIFDLTGKMSENSNLTETENDVKDYLYDIASDVRCLY